jgi:YD repeat-containing protein
LTGSNAISKSSLNAASIYIVGFWEDSSVCTVTVNGATPTLKATFGNWKYYEATVTGTTSITVSGTGIVDELKLFPKGSLMTTYTYAPLIGLTGQCDPSGKIIYYSYDGLGRLKLIKDQYGNILKRYDYQYQSANN